MNQQEVRDHVNQQVAQWQEEKKADLIPGVLFIDEVHMLDIECFSFLNRAMEADNAPIIIMASNRKSVRIRGTTDIGAHGIPHDLLQRLTIIQTKKYERNELETILRMRCAEEDVTMSTEGLQKLREIARLKSLRYAMQLITISSLIAARRNKDDEVGAGDVARGMQLFMDTARSQDKVQRDTVGYIVDFTARNADDDKAVPEEEEEEGD